jgi:hypothetical protein
VFLHRHNDPIAGSQIEHKEIPKEMKSLSGERVGDRECAAVDLRPDGRGGQRANVTRGAPYLVEKSGAFLCPRSVQAVPTFAFGSSVEDLDRTSTLRGQSCMFRRMGRFGPLAGQIRLLLLGTVK